MKKIILLLLIFFPYITFGYKDCSKETSKYMQEVTKDGLISPFYGSQLREQYYNSCINSNELELSHITSFNEKGVELVNNGNHLEAINYYKKFLDERPFKDNNSYNVVKGNLVSSLLFIGDSYYEKKDFNKAIFYYSEAINYNLKKDLVYTNLGLSYGKMDNYEKSKYYFDLALKITTNKDLIKTINDQLEYIIEKENQKLIIKNAPTNDILSGYQYYLKQLNIPKAWEKLTNNNQVIVAIIDDGININHPDLLDNIWTHPKAKYGDSKIIDFVGDGLPANLPVGEHGTMIAGIIGAKQNNNEGIAGIAKNIKFMPLRVFDSKGNAKEENIIKAIEYAIDNGANIINLSLGSSQFNYSTKYDIVIKKAFDKGVTVVISAGNGDILSGQNTGINLTNNPISPVCNNGGKYKYSIGVSATDLDGYRTNWTNYGNCAQFFAPGVGIISTSIPVYNSNYGSNYNIADGTSYSAPIISGIVALGYNQYGYVSPIDVYEALEKSKVKDEKVGYKIDASKYIDILGEKNKTQKEKQVIIDNENEQKQKAEVAFNQIKKKFSKLPETKRKTTYNSILKQLNGFKGKVKGDKEIILNHLIFLVNEELGINQGDDLKDLFGDLFNK